MSTDNSKSVKNPIVWIDCEMTGLDPEVDELVEIAVIITDSDLNPLAEGIDIVIKPSAASLAQMSPFVTQMHTDSGLINEFDSGVPLKDAEVAVLEYVSSIISQPGVAPIAGNSIGQDVRFLRAYMPNLVEYMHYRIIDVSSIKELSRRWYPRAYFQAPEKNGGHRALADILESIDELRYYREAVFVPQPGPDSATAKAVSARITETSVTQRPAITDEPGNQVHSSTAR